MKDQIGLILGNERVSASKIVEVAFEGLKIELSGDEIFVQKIKASRRVLEEKLANDEVIYGVTTGYGDSCNVKIPKDIQGKLPLQLTRYHQCGLGDFFSEKQTRAIQLVRIISLTQGYSAVRYELLQHMVDLYNLGVTARIPQEGSVGASGDLTPLSYYAATLVGEGHAVYQGEVYATSELLQKLNIAPIVLAEKEALALMNGTAVMTAIACEVFSQAEYLSKVASRITSASSLALLANASHFNETLFEAKPHFGTKKVAKFINDDLKSAVVSNSLTRLQDRYSIRCAPHIIGVLVDALESFKPILEIEINSANDNPLIDVQNEKVLHGGNFYGGHIAFLMDSLKILIANIADLIDRQIALLVDTKFNNGLPANISAAQGDEAYLYHGLKAVQISSSAWTAEALKNTLSASIFSRSTECHNQDKVSMGTIAARDALRVLELTRQVVAAGAMCSAQALDVRINNGELSEESLGNNIATFKQAVRSCSDILHNDRPLDRDLLQIIGLLENADEGFVRC